MSSKVGGLGRESSSISGYYQYRVQVFFFGFVLLQERSFILLLLNCPTTKNATEVGFHGLRAARVERQAI